MNRSITVGTLIAAAAAIVLIIWYFGRANLCANEVESCSREWLAALSGWAAVAAAVPTIVFLSKQVRDAERYHREGLRFELRRTRALFMRTDRIIKRARYHCSLVTRLAEEDTVALPATDLLAAFDDLIKCMKSRDFQLFESEFSPPDSDDIENLVSQLEEFRKGLIEAIPNGKKDEFMSTDIPESTRYTATLGAYFATSYLEACQRLVDDALAEYEQVTALSLQR